MIEGFVTISGLKSPEGKKIPTQKAVDLGWIIPSGKKPAGWGIEREEIPMGHNLFVDNGRQIIAYLFGGQTPSGSYVCSRFGLGTGSTPPTVSDTDLDAPVNFYDPGSGPLLPTKPIDGVDYPAPFIARVYFTIASTEANGILATELGIYSAVMGGGQTTLLARKLINGVELNSSFSPVWAWRLRF